MRELGLQFRQAAAASTYRPGFGGMLLGSKYRQQLRAAGERRKEMLRANRGGALASYESTKQIVDSVILQLEREKLRTQGG